MKDDFHFIHSGNGDTILIRSNDEWALIDANFTDGSGSRQRVEEHLKGVERLSLLCITHFDLDHIRGLASFLEERFSLEDASGQREWLIDRIVLPLSAGDLMHLLALNEAFLDTSESTSIPELAELSGEAIRLFSIFFSIASEYDRRGRTAGTELVWLPAGVKLKGRNGITSLGPWHIYSLGPSLFTAQSYVHQLLGSFKELLPQDRFFKQVTSNGVSRVLGMLDPDTGAAVMLTGDATPESIDESLREWCNILGCREGTTFDGVKVSHHGAHTGHAEVLYRDHCISTRSVAVICAADDGSHPHQAVIDDLNKYGISYSVTGRKTPSVDWLPGSPVEEDTVCDVRLSFDGSKAVLDGGRRSILHR